MSVQALTKFGRENSRRTSQFVPVMVVWKMKLVMSTGILEDTPKVSVAAVDWPGNSLVPS